MGLPVTKQWSAAGQNTRDTHAELDGTVVGVDEPFVSSSGAEMMYPGEAGAPAAEVVNCRCVLVPGVGIEKENEREESLGGEVETESQREDVPTAASPIFVNMNDDLFRNAKNIKPIDGYEDIVCHADSRQFYFYDRFDNATILEPKEFANIVRQSPNYHGGNIRLLACDAGAEDDGSAQLLADELNVVVMAPTKTLFVYEDGEYFVGKDRFTRDGDWIIIKPRKEVR